MDRQFLLIGSGVLVLIAAAIGVSLINTSGSDSFDLGQDGKVAVIQLSGAVSPSQSTGLGARSTITPDSVRELNQQAENQGADAIIYEINSGGGAVVASKEVMREMESVDKPTVCRFRDIAASGAYLFAMGCDEIVSDSASLTGSIGVRSSYLEFSGLLNKLGIQYVNTTAGERKDLGSQYRNVTDEERQLLQQKADRVHQEFIDLVDRKRNLSESELEEATTGEPFLGERAREIGLVDHLGGREAAVDAAENLTGKELNTVKVERQPSFNIFSLLSADSFLGNFVDRGSPLMAKY